MAKISGSKSLVQQIGKSISRGLILFALTLIATLATHRAASAQQNPRPLYIMNADGTNLRQLTQLIDHECSGSPMWSKNGKHILFDAWRKSETATEAHVYKVNVDGTWPTDLGPGAMPSGIPGSETLFATHYYGKKQGVWLGTKHPTLVDRDAGSPRWHPSEQKLAYVSWNGGIMMRTVTETGIGDEEVLVPAKHRPYVGFSWSPDGKAIAFCSHRNSSEDKTELLVMNITDLANEPEVKATGKIGWIVSWSPDGKKIAFSNFSEETQTQQIYIADPMTNAVPHRLAGQDPDRGNGDSAWSNDGKQIVFTSRIRPNKVEAEKKE